MANACLDKNDQTIVWLNKFGPGNLDPNKLKEVLYFSLMWGLFERNTCNEEANPSRIESAIANLHTQNKLQIQNFQAYLVYFQSRYVENGGLNSKFDGLHCERLSQKNQQTVTSALLGQVADVDKVVMALLLGIYRLRNNFFHGVKSVQHLDEDQVKNFEIANSLLATTLDLIV
jgi:formate dehydrogenase maturation protein FdhE